MIESSKRQNATGVELTRLAVTETLDGVQLNIPVHVIHGTQPGPCLALISTLHGNEWHSMEVLRQFYNALEPSSLRGTVMVVPVANPSAFETQTRNTQGMSDVGDLNRVFPGSGGWLNYQMARALTEGVLKKADYVIDFHPGSWGSAMQNVGYGGDYSNHSVIERSFEMALAYGVYSIRQTKTVTAFPGPNSLTGYSGEVLGIPGLAISVGGSGFADEFEQRWWDINVKGIFSVMRSLGMYDEAEDRHLGEYLHSAGRGHIVNPQRAGLLLSHVTPDDMGPIIKKGRHLATIVSPYTFEVLEELHMPADGLLFCIPRKHPVEPGSWAFFIADVTDPQTRVISRNTRLDDL